MYMFISFPMIGGVQDIGGALKPEQIVGKDGPISGLAMRVLFTGGSR